MNTHKYVRALGIACGILMACVSQAHATSVTLSDGGVTLGVNDINVSFTGGSPSGGVTVGQFSWTVTNPLTSGYAQGQVLSTFCIQGGQFATNGTFTIENLESSGVPEGGSDAGDLDSTAAMQIQGFGNSFFADVNAGNITVGSNTYTASEVAAAFQLGIWEIEYDGGSGGEAFPEAANYNYFSTSDTHHLFNASSTHTDGEAAIALANIWLNDFTAATSVTSLALVSSSDQDQMMYMPGGGTPPPPAVPLPEALPAGLALMGGLGVVRFIRRRTIG